MLKIDEIETLESDGMMVKVKGVNLSHFSDVPCERLEKRDISLIAYVRDINVSSY